MVNGGEERFIGGEKDTSIKKRMGEASDRTTKGKRGVNKTKGSNWPRKGRKMICKGNISLQYQWDLRE